MPFRNEHACRVRDPGLFEDGSFRRVQAESDGKALSMIMGRLPGEDDLTLQAYRYPAREAGIRDGWTVGAARRHCRTHDGDLFEPAEPGSQQSLDYAPEGRLQVGHTPARGGVDREKARLNAVSIIELGIATGHGFEIDSETLQDVIRLGNDAPHGIKVRFTHPHECSGGADRLGDEVGRALNFRLSADEQRVLADVQLLDAAMKSPRGNLHAWILDMAEEDPDAFTMSINAVGPLKTRVGEDGIPLEDDDGDVLPPVWRLNRLIGADLVDEGAANRQGLFGGELAAVAGDTLDGLLVELDLADRIIGEDQLLALARRLTLHGTTLSLPRGANPLEFSLSAGGALTAARYLEYYLDTRGIRHPPVDPALLRRVLTRLDKETAMKLCTTCGTTLRDDGTCPNCTSTAATVTKTAPNEPVPGVPGAPGATPARTALSPQPPDVQAAVASAINAEYQRQNDIRALGTLFGREYDLQTTVDGCLSDRDCTIELARERVLKRIAELQASPEVSVAPVTVGQTSEEKFVLAAADGLLLRAGVIRDVDEGAADIRATGLANLGPKQLARVCMRRAGIGGVEAMSDDELWNRCSRGYHGPVAWNDPRNPRGLASAVTHSAGDFPLILANVGNKALIMGFERAPVTFRRWCKIGNLNDFKSHHRLRLSESPHLKIRPEAMPAQHGTFAELRELITADNKALAFSYTRQMFLNDDLGAFADLGTLMGRGAIDTIEFDVIALLVSNAKAGPTMSDSKALFHADHDNLFTAAAPSQTTIEEMVEKMMTQKGIGEDGANTAVGAPPRYFLAKPSLAWKIAAIIGAPFRETGSGESQSLQAPQTSELAAAEAIPVPQLALQATTDWYGVADQAQAPSMEVGFIGGIQTPRVVVVQGGTVDGTTVVIDLDYGIFPTGGWQGISRNPGS